MMWHSVVRVGVFFNEKIELWCGEVSSFEFWETHSFLKEQIVVGCDAVGWECECKSMLVDFGWLVYYKFLKCRGHLCLFIIILWSFVVKEYKVSIFHLRALGDVMSPLAPSHIHVGRVCYVLLISYTCMWDFQWEKEGLRLWEGYKHLLFFW